RALVGLLLWDQVQVWDLMRQPPARHEPIVCPGHLGRAVISPDGQSLLLPWEEPGKGHGVQSLPLNRLMSGGVEPIRYPLSEPVTALATHLGRKLLATGHAQGKVRLWKGNGTALEPLDEIATLRSSAVTALAFAGEGDSLVVLFKTGPGCLFAL